jgi:drug/metabolite transporter (DMT)-like permease
MDSNKMVVIEKEDKEDIQVKRFHSKHLNEMIKIVKRLRGYVLAIFSSFSNSLATTMVRKAHFISGSEQSFVRYLLSLIILIPIALFLKNLNIFGDKPLRFTLIARGTFGFIGLVTITFAFKLIDPSDATVIFYSNIIVVSILARIFLKEKMTIACLFSIFLCSIGLIMVTQPSFLFNKNEQQFYNSSDNQTESHAALINDTLNSFSLKTTIGVTLALISVLASSSVQILLKKLANQNVHFSVASLYTAYVGIPFTLIISIILVQFEYSKNPLLILNDIPHHKWQIVYSLLGALLGLLSQSCFNMAYFYEDAIKISILRITEIPFTFLFQYLILEIVPNSLSTIGALLITVASLILMIFKFFDTKFTKKRILKEENQLIELERNNNREIEDEEEEEEEEDGTINNDIKNKNSKYLNFKKAVSKIIFYKF